MLSILRKSTLSFALGATLVAGSNVAAFAQSQSINGTIRGRAADATGASIPGASVAVTNTDVGYAKTVTTDDDGLFVLLNLPLGTYKISVTKPGFSSVDYQSIVLNAGKELTLDPTLKVGGTTTEVEVTTETGGINPSSLNLERTLDAREVQNLPLTSRNPYNFILFQPGVSGHPNPELGIPRTINTNGLLDRINYQMDGMVNTESDRIGLRLFPVGEIFVKEVQTVANSFAPEFGWTTGNVYNVISNNGTNSLHGKFQYIQRWQDATAYPYFANKSLAKTNIEMEDVAANLGGRIIKDKLFFFGSYEKITRGSPAAVTITPANIAALGLTADQVAAAPGLLHGTFVLGRGDWNINKKNSLFVRYNYFKNDFPYNTQVGALNTRSTGVDFLDRAHVIGAQLVTTVNDHLINELRFSWPFRNNSHFAPAGRATGPAIVINGAANLGASSNGGDQYNDKVPSGNENISYVRGSHTMKFGFNVSKILNRQRAISSNIYTFTSVANYLAAKNGTNPYAYSTFTSTTDTLGLGYSSQFMGFYGQDTWQASKNLVVVYGLRYDRFKSPNSNPNALFANSRSFNTPNTNFSPRVGLSYRLGDKTVVKSSVGIFYQAPPTNLWFNALNLDGSNRTSNYTYTIGSTVPAGAPAFPSIPSATGTVQTQSVTTISPKFKNEYTWNATLQLSRELGRHDSMILGYVMANGRNLQFLRNINPINPIGTLLDGRPVFNSAASATTRFDPRFNQINQVESGATASFNALIFNYTHTLVRGIQLNANYTWSHSLSDAPEVNTFEVATTGSFIQDTTSRGRDRANSSVNHPHAFNMTAVIEPTFSLQNRFAKEVVNHNMVALLGNVMSGDQASIFTGVSLNNDSSAQSVTRPIGVGRNTLRSPSVYQVDGRFTRTFPKLFDHLETSLFLEANNIFNHTNVTNLAVTQPVVGSIVTNGIFTNPGTAGTPSGPAVTVRSSVLEARIVQWGVAARW
ncbi:MAG: putative collagen-binding protein [Acidobacteriaceae bacterium]|nr:putative collagen-binding protein [Acidobacteriaceae bacterium]